MATSELVVSLQSYIVQLQTQNKALKTHIFKLQNKEQSMHSSFHDENEKLKVHIEHCQNQIMKREGREVGLVEMVGELEASREEVSRERDLYMGEMETLRKGVVQAQQQIHKLKEDIQRQEVRLKHYQLQQRNSQTPSIAHLPPTPPSSQSISSHKMSQSLPPKQAKARPTDSSQRAQQTLTLQLQQCQATIDSLRTDIACLQQFI